MYTLGDSSGHNSNLTTANKTSIQILNMYVGGHHKQKSWWTFPLMLNTKLINIYCEVNEKICKCFLEEEEQSLGVLVALAGPEREEPLAAHALL